MSNVVRTDKNALEAILTVTVSASDYAPKIQQEVKKYTQKAQMKGFRPGKTPASVVKKMYGSSFMADIVNKEIEHLMSEYMETEKLDILGQPLPSEQQERNVFSTEAPQDMVYHFDIGLTPQIEVKGLDTTLLVERYEVQIEAADIETAWQRALKQGGKRESVVEPIELNDFVFLAATQGSIEKEVKVLVEQMSDAAQAVLLGKNVGDLFEFDVYQLENDTTEEFVDKQLLGLEADEILEGGIMQFKVANIERIAPAVVDEAFLSEMFGPNVHNEMEARTAIIEQLRMKFVPNEVGILYRNIQEKLVELNDVQLPDAFLKRWLLESNKKATAADIEREYSYFANNLKWTMLRGQIAKDADIKVGYEELREFYKARIRGYLGGMANEGLENSLADRVMEDEKQVNELYEECMTQTVFGYIATQVQVTNKSVTREEFEAIIQALNAQMQAERTAQKPAEIASPVEAEMD